MSKNTTDHLPFQATTEVKKLTQKLAEPFELQYVHFRPAVVTGTRAMAIAYVDARAIQDRLDDILGTENWKDEYEFLEDGSVMCRLSLRLAGEWISKMDVGGQSEQPDEGDRRKAAVSDSLKRAAVKFGIGRYLYRLPTLWVDYDPRKKKFVRDPVLPPSALPPRTLPAPTVKKNDKAIPKKAPEKTPDKVPVVATAPGLPTTGVELQRRLYAKDEKLSSEGLCKKGELILFIVEAGKKAKLDSDLSTWDNPDSIRLAVEQTKAFEAQQRQKKDPPRTAA